MIKKKDELKLSVKEPSFDGIFTKWSWKHSLESLCNKIFIDSKLKCLRDRRIVTVVAIIITITIYWGATNYLDPSRNIFKRTWDYVMGNDYTIHVASPQGVYAKIGNYLESKSQDDRRGIIVENQGGSAEILEEVLKNNTSLGIVQEDYLFEADIAPRQFKETIPLYAEPMHILYREAKWHEIAGTDSIDEEPVLSVDCEDKVRSFFESSIVRVGSSQPARSSASVLKLCGLKPKKREFKSFKVTKERLLDGTIDIAFYMIGAPAESLEGILKKNSGIGLMSIDARLVRELNSVFDRCYYPFSFYGKYDDEDDDDPRYNHVTTFASRAVLLASWGVRGSSIRNICDKLQEWKIKEQDKNPITEFSTNQHSRIMQAYSGPLGETLETWVLSLLFLILCSAFLIACMTWLISCYKEVYYVRDITNIYRNGLPRHDKLDFDSSLPETTEVIGMNEKICDKIIQGISNLLWLAMRIRDDYETGGMTVSHQQNLIDNIYTIKGIFQTHLAQRLNESTELGLDYKEEKLRRLYTAGYLKREDYLHLQALHKGDAEPVTVDRRSRVTIDGSRKAPQGKE